MKTFEELLELSDEELAVLYEEYVNTEEDTAYGRLIVSVVDEILKPNSRYCLLT